MRNGVTDPLVLSAYHDKVRRWVRIGTPMYGQAAVEEMLARQDRVRRRGEPCVFKLLPEGEDPGLV